MTQFGRDLIESLSEVLDFVEGRPTAMRVHAPEIPDIRSIRRGLQMSQQRFAEIYRIPLPTLKNWEQGRRFPDAPAMAYLQAISCCPDAIREAFAGRRAPS